MKLPNFFFHVGSRAWVVRLNQIIDGGSSQSGF